jgi:HD-GYP domain-containing protein (c-di-GMP phosphodiesterase class II)
MLDANSQDATETIARLRAEVAEHERVAAERERELERSIADLKETRRVATEVLRRSYVATVRALANAVEARDAYTGKHADRVAAYGMAIGTALGLELTDAPEVEFGFLLHDVGKVAVPDAILFKAERLTEDEFRLIARHPVVGSEILDEIDFLGDAKLVVRHHHERWDGAGYPDGLAGEAIPVLARVFAVADTLDALTTDRPYRPASSWAVAREEIMAGSGTQFDPAVVEAYNRVSDDELAAICRRLGSSC